MHIGFVHLILPFDPQKLMEEMTDPEMAYSFYNAVTRQHLGLSSGLHFVSIFSLMEFERITMILSLGKTGRE